jgi:hypothetical protein
VRSRRDALGGLIVSDEQDAISHLSACQGAPASRKCGGEGRFPEIDGDRVVDHPAQPGRRDLPPLGAAIVIKPRVNAASRSRKPAGGTATRTRAAKRRSASVIIRRELAATFTHPCHGDGLRSAVASLFYHVADPLGAFETHFVADGVTSSSPSWLTAARSHGSHAAD